MARNYFFHFQNICYPGWLLIIDLFYFDFILAQSTYIFVSYSFVLKYLSSLFWQTSVSARVYPLCSNTIFYTSVNPNILAQLLFSYGMKRKISELD